MPSINTLIIEDDERFSQESKTVLERLSSDIQVDIASTYDKAIVNIRNKTYTLFIVDLQLDNEKTKGMSILQDIRNTPHNQNSAIIILTGNASTPIVDRAKSEYKVFRVIDKHDFHPSFSSSIPEAILDTRLVKAFIANGECYYLNILYDDKRLRRIELIGTNQQNLQVSEIDQHFEVEDLVRRTDLLNWIILKGGIKAWRSETRSIGSTLYATLFAQKNAYANLIAAQVLAQLKRDVCLQFKGPAIGLGVPFELLHQHKNYLSLKHVLTRQITSPAFDLSRRTKPPFHEFIEKLHKKQEVLRILIVGSNSDGRIFAAEEEAIFIASFIEKELTFLGISHKITLLSGTNASYQTVVDTLTSDDFHIFHYSGHSCYDDKLPEGSGLVLRDGKRLRTLTATQLHSFATDKRLYLVYLSSCLSARTADRAGEGDFYSIFEALASASVPIIIGYRWDVVDKRAIGLAKVFYQQLWLTFSPGKAMLEARKSASTQDLGLNDDTWASPVLLIQNT